MGQLNEQQLSIGVSGHLRAIITNHDTGQVREYDFDNKITSALLGRIAQWIVGINNTGQNPAYPPSKFQMGTGSGTPAVGDPDLFTPVSGSLISVSAMTYSGNQATLTINYPQNYILGTFTEGGLKDVNGILLSHVMLTPSVQIVANESVTFIYVITVNAQ